jgi:hypothetical protein
MIVDDLFENVAGPEKCWPGYRKVGTKPGTGRNKGKRVNDCEKINESAGELRIGDPVIITGDVQFRGKTGDVREFDRDGSFVVVNLYNYGAYSFHVSDVSYNDYADEEDEEDVVEGYDGEELANEVYAEFERMYPNLARRANERTVHAAIMDVLNYGGDSDPAALAQDVARAVKRDIQGVAEEKAGWSIKTDKPSQPTKKGPAPSWRLNPDGTTTDMNSGVTYNRDGSKKPGVTEGDTAAERQQALLDRLAARVGLPAGSSMDEIEAAQQAQLNRPQPAVARPQPTDDADFAAGLAAAQSGQGPLAIMLAQPTIANDQRLLDTIASSYGLPAGLSAQEIQAQSRGALTQTAVSSIARALDLPPGLNRTQLLAAFKQQQGVAEAGNKPVEKYRLGMGDNRTARELKTQMQGASDEFVKYAAKDVGPFHSRVAKMQGKLAKSELRNRAADHDRLATGTNEGVVEVTGDEKFDKMLKGVTSKKAVAKQQKTDTKQQARDAFGGMFGGGNPADKLGIRPKGVAETALNPKNPRDDLAAKRQALQQMQREPGHDQQAVRQRVLDLEKEAKAKGVSEGWKQNLAALGVAGALGLGSVGGAQAATDPVSDKIVATLVIDGETRVFDLSSKNFNDVREASKWLEDFLDARGVENWSGKVERGTQGSGNYQRMRVDSIGPPIREADTDRIADRYDPEEFDQMVLRLKTLAGAGPLKTVWDPQKRVYRNVPINQPQDKK